MKFFNILLFVILTLSLADANSIYKNKKENSLKKSNYKNGM